MKLFNGLKQKFNSQRETGASEAEAEVSQELPPKYDQQSSQIDRINRISMLTPRERALFLLLLEGYTLKESAKQLSVKYSTVNTHMTSIYRKLKVNSRAELIIRYQEIGTKPD